MARTQPILMLEFNELTPDLLKRFESEGYLPNFAKFRSEAEIFITDAEESDELLDPWIQWVTAHTGQSADEHGIVNLDEGPKLKFKNIWELINAVGKSVWVCGSMNIRAYEGVKGALLPDPWSTSVAPYPADLNIFHHFVSGYVQEHTRENVPIGVSEYVSFLWFMVRNGLSRSTVCAILRQLARERGGKYRWKRVEILDRLQWDLFYSYYQKIRPDFSTFFLNSTAHLQHKFWRNMDPDSFKVQPSASEQLEWQDAVLFGYQSMDRLLGRIFRDISENVTLVFCTGLSQQPCALFDDSGGKYFYHCVDVNELVEFAGVQSTYTVAPVMSGQYRVRFESIDDALRASEKLERLSLNGSTLLDILSDGNALILGCRVYTQLPRESLIEVSPTGTGKRFFDFFYQADTVKSGMHHPDGILWIRTPEKKQIVHEKKVSLRAVAPTMLDLLGVPVPDSMKERPLLDALGVGNQDSEFRNFA